MTAADVDLIVDRLDDMKDQQDRIEAKVTETNGRVKVLELWKARRDGANATLSWFSPILSGVVVASIAYLLTRI